ncbi:hypothetical protein [Nocardioides sp.]|uniref:hypothetical protein n=1 Tax=Nocardioides sp. TaxID=35761 RepID=UPI0027365D34|nr:hypothetical protein [Nocardioides sp.]MDP3893691.1 hypothetical protein [Nocardioides sp.]
MSELMTSGPVSDPTPEPTARQQVTCPGCGAVSSATLNRRDAADFCTTCDFPLFWTTSEVVAGDPRQSAEDALRRLPGTDGRVTVASLPCPTCAEANTLSALVCRRCGGPMVLPTPVEPVVVAPPPPAPEPARSPYRTWVVVVAVLTVIMLLAVIGVWVWG